MNVEERAWSLSEAFPWLGEHIHDNFLSQTYVSETYFRDPQTPDENWGDFISAPISELEESTLEELLFHLGRYRLNLKFGSLFPFLPRTLQIESLKLSVRSYNCLRREGYESFEDLAGAVLDDIKDIRNLGSSSAGEIFNSLFRANIKRAIEAWASGSPLDAPIAQDKNSVSAGIQELIDRTEAQRNIASAFDEIGSWRVVSDETSDLSLLNIEMCLLEGESKEILSNAIGTLRNAAQEIHETRPPLFETLASNDLVAQDVVVRRVCAERQLSLQELGDIHRLSRERIRQIENSAKKIYAHIVESDPRVKYLVSNLKAKVRPLETASLVLANFPNTSTYPALRGLSDLEIIFGFEPGFHIFDGLFSTIERGQLEKSIIQISKSDPSVGLLSEAAFIDLLDTEIGNGGVAYDFGTKNQLFEFRHGLIIPIRTGLTELAELALASRGKPMKFEELTEIIISERSERSLSNALHADPRFIRTSLTDWALAAWDVDEYTNIKGEILEVLDRQDSIAIDELVEILTSKYGVSASSVGAYASTWPFQNINGVVTKSDSSQVSYGRPFPNQKELLNINGNLLIRLRFGSEQERGSGSTVSKAVAAFLGINHGDFKEFNFPSRNLSVRVSFVGLQPSFGSVRDLALAVGAERGDNLFISLGEKSEIYKRDGSSSLSICDLEEFLGNKIGELPKEDIRRIFAEVLCLDSAETFPAIFAALRNRGELDLESELKGLIGDNQAFNLEINFKNDSKFRISRIDDI